MRGVKYESGLRARLSRGRGGMMMVGTVAASICVAACGSSGSGSSGASNSASPSGGGKSKTSKTFTIGAMLDQNDLVGVGGAPGLQMAVDQINAHGGVNGVKLMIDTANSLGTASGGVAAARLLVSKHVGAIIADSSSDAAVAAAPIAEQAKIPFLSSDAPDDILASSSNAYQWMSPAVPLTQEVTSEVAFIKRMGWKTVAIVAPISAFGHQNEQLLGQKLPAIGVKIVKEENIPSVATGQAPDYTPLVQAVKSSHAQAVLVYADYTGGMFTTSRNFGLNVPEVYDPTAVAPGLLEGIGKVSTSGLYGYTMYAKYDLGSHAPEMAKWRAEFNSTFPHHSSQVPNAYSLPPYQAAYVLAQALSQASAPTSAGVNAAFPKINNFVLGKTAFTFAPQIALPVSFSGGRHYAGGKVTPVDVKDGAFAELP